MPRTLTLISTTAALVLAAGSGFLWILWQEDRNRLAQLGEELAETRGELSRSRAALAALETDLAALRERQKALEVSISARETALRAARASFKEESEGDAPESSAPPQLIGRERYVLTSVEEADALAAELFARGDLEGIWQLAADLLGMGELGYEKLIELAAFFDDKERSKQIQNLWSREEYFLGSFIRDLTLHSGDVLRFGLYLDGKDSSTLPGFVQEIKRELDDDFGPILFDIYDGEDGALLDAHVERYRRGIDEGALHGRNVRIDEIANVLGHIPTESATELLLDVAETVPAEKRREIAPALAWKRDQRALPLLESWRQEATEPRLIETLNAAIRFLK